jgi:hypothetical protein
MPGTMSQADLIADLKRSVGDACAPFDAPVDGDWKRFLTVALVAMQDKRPRTLLGSVTLVADEPMYPLALADFVQYKTYVWGGRQAKPWSPGYPGGLPRVCAEQNGATWTLLFDPAPTAAHLAAYGSTFRFWYFGAHALGADDAASTLAAADRPLLLLRAQAECMRELSMRNVNKPVALRDGYSGQPRNSTPAALWDALLREWKAAK